MVLTIAASGFDFAQISGGDIEPAAVKRAHGIATKGLVKRLMADIKRARPQRMNSRKSALFKPANKKEFTFAETIVEKIQFGQGSRFEYLK